MRHKHRYKFSIMMKSTKIFTCNYISLQFSKERCSNIWQFHWTKRKHQNSFIWLGMQIIKDIGIIKQNWDKWVPQTIEQTTEDQCLKFWDELLWNFLTSILIAVFFKHILNNMFFSHFLGVLFFTLYHLKNKISCPMLMWWKNINDNILMAEHLLLDSCSSCKIWIQ